MTYSNGDVYDGFWEDNYPQGHGVLTCSSGVKYDGAWADGLVEHIPIYRFPRIC